MSCNPNKNKLFFLEVNELIFKFTWETKYIRIERKPQQRRGNDGKNSPTNY